MELTLDWAAHAAERHPCPKCGAPAGSACRTRSGKVAAKYHTARFILVPALREELAVAVPADRGLGTPWKPGPPIPAAEPQPTAAPIRIGYARCSTAQQELEIQIDALGRANCKRVFSEKISSRIKVRPEFEKAVALARDIKQAAPDQPVTLTAHEMKRLARNAAELIWLSFSACSTTSRRHEPATGSRRSSRRTATGSQPGSPARRTSLTPSPRPVTSETPTGCCSSAAARHGCTPSQWVPPRSGNAGIPCCRTAPSTQDR